MDKNLAIFENFKIRRYYDDQADIWYFRLCGDFNLQPNTESIRIIEKEMTNLITKYDIKTIRTDLYTKSEKFADYVFISPDVQEKDFKVLSDIVSDHAPLLVEI